MKPAFCFIFLLALTSFIACKKEEESNPYPVWLLEVRAVEEISDIGIPFPPVNGCPQGIFHVVPEGRDSIVGCHDHSNEVKIWNHIDNTITVEYYIRCDGYYDSDPRQVTFRVEDAYQRPGRDGAEALEIDTVIMQPF